MKTRVGIIGGTGYTGVELLRLLLLHPEVEVTAITSQKYAGLPIDQVFPSLTERLQLKCEELSIDQIAEKVDFIFAAVPHKTAMETVPLFYQRGKRVVDLSADFRLRDPAVYERWYHKAYLPGVTVRVRLWIAGASPGGDPKSQDRWKSRMLSHRRTDSADSSPEARDHFFREHHRRFEIGREWCRKGCCIRVSLLRGE